MFFHFPDAGAIPAPAAPPDLAPAGVGRRLAWCRRKLRLRQNELAKRCNVAASAISRFENGAARPSLETLCRLAHALDVSLDFLAGRTDAPLAHRRVGMEFARRSGLSGREAALGQLSTLAEVLAQMDGRAWAGHDAKSPEGAALPSSRPKA